MAYNLKEKIRKIYIPFILGILSTILVGYGCKQITTLLKIPKEGTCYVHVKFPDTHVKISKYYDRDGNTIHYRIHDGYENTVKTNSRTVDDFLSLYSKSENCSAFYLTDKLLYQINRIDVLKTEIFNLSKRLEKIEGKK